MKNKLNYLLFLFFIFFSLVVSSFSEEQIEMNQSSKHISKEINEEYIINLKIQTTLDYLNIEMKEEKKKSHVISYSQKIDFSKREQLSQSFAKNVVMILSNTQIKSGEGNYFSFQCGEYPCIIDIDFTMVKDLSMVPIPLNTQFTYYVTEENKIMTYHFKNDFPKDTSYITFSAIGSKIIKTTLNGGNYGEKSENYEIYNLEVSLIESNTISFKIEGNPGDLISLSAYTFMSSNNFANFNIGLNSPRIIGLIKKDSSRNKACFKFTFSDENDKKRLKEEKFFYLNGELFNDIAGIVNFYTSSATSYICTEGSFSQYHEYSENEENGICINFRFFNIEEITFSIQITNSKSVKLKTPIYSPQNLGQIYPRTLNNGEIATYIGMSADSSAKKLKYSLITLVGFTDMFFYTCTSYPFCEYNKDKIKNIVNPHNINGVSSYSINNNNTEMTPISLKQNVLVVNCTEGSSDKTEYRNFLISDNPHCEFLTLIYSDSDPVKLIEDLTYNQFIEKNDIDKYYISFKNLGNVKEVYVDVMVFSGDVDFELIEKNKEFVNHKYRFANKIFYNITVNSNVTEEQKILNFEVKPIKSSFYSIRYTLISYITNINIPLDVNYLVTIQPFALSDDGDLLLEKNLYYNSIRVKDGHPFLFNFYSLNCKLEIYLKESNEEILLPSKDNYYTQYIISKNNNDPKTYHYVAKLLDIEPGAYDQKLCMLYTSSLELSKDDSLVKRQILVIENMPQNVVFQEGYETIKYLYVIPDLRNDIGIRFQLFDKAKYTVVVYLHRSEFNSYEITSNQQILLLSKDYSNRCPKDQPCAIILDILCQKRFIEREPRLEFAIKSIEDAIYPTYLIKNKVNLDYLNSGLWSFYYTDIGQFISGEITVNFHRSSGVIFGKIVQKTINKPDSLKPDWRIYWCF